MNPSQSFAGKPVLIHIMKAESTRKRKNPLFEHYMIDFMCQLDCALGCPDICLNILGVSVRCFQMGLSFQSAE